MSKTNLGSFFDNSFYCALGAKKSNNSSFEYHLEHLKKVTEIIEKPFFIRCLMRAYCDIKKRDVFQLTEDYFEALTKIVLNYAVENDALSFLFEDEDVEKIKGVLKRNQLNAKLVKLALTKLDYVFSVFGSDCTELEKILRREIDAEFREIDNARIVSKFSKLKEVVDKVTSGVKAACYIELEHYTMPDNLHPEISDYIRTKHGYELNRESSTANYVTNYSAEMALSLALVNDEKMWGSDNYIGFKYSLYRFLNSVYINNSITHVKKIVDYIFEEYQKTQEGKYIYDNKLGLWLTSNIANITTEYSYRHFARFINNVNISNFEKAGLLYPVNKESYIAQVNEGKKAFNSIIKELYPTCYDEINKLFSDGDTVLQEGSDTKVHQTMHSLIETFNIGFLHNNEWQVIDFLYGFYDDFGNYENVLNRMYYHLYLFKKYSDSSLISNVYEYYYDVFNMIEERYGYKCSLVSENKKRNDNYEKLTVILKEQGIETKEEFKENYVISLLDRKYASVNEQEMFPVLEQKGDAIYDMAVSNILFYQDDDEIDNMLDQVTLERYANANAQIIVANRLGINKLYISDSKQVRNSIAHNEGKFIADSLEMIIGSISVEFGVQKALDFATKIIVDTFEELSMPQFIDYSLDAIYQSEYREEYIQKIFPAPRYAKYADYYGEYNTLEHSLLKLINIFTYGNETSEKRKKITFNMFTLLCNEEMDSRQVIVHYLYHGIKETIKYVEKHSK